MTGQSRAAGIVMLAGGALVVISAFLPWLTATAPFVGTVNRSLVDLGGDGWLLLIGGTGLLAFGLTMALQGARNWIGFVSLLPTALAAWVVVVDAGEVAGRVQNLTSGENTFIIASVGPGPYASGLGIITAVVAALMAIGGGKARATETVSEEPTEAEEPLPPDLPGRKLGDLSPDEQFYWNGERWLPNS